TGLALVAAFAVGATVAGAGPFVRADARESLLLLDVFLAVVAGTTLVMAAVMAERRAAEDALRASQAELRELNADLERRVADRAAELARSEAARRDTEDRFRAFTDHSPAVCFMKDEDGRYAYLSRTFEARFGIRAEDWLGKTDRDIWPADLAARLRANDLAVLASDRPLDVVEEVADPDGTVHSWRSLKFAFRDAAGRRYVGGTAVDITDQRRAEAALRAGEEEFRRLFEDSPIGVYRTTPDGRILRANPAFVRMLGYPSFEALAAHNPERDGVHADYDRAEFKRRLDRDGEVRGLEASSRRVGGGIGYFRENARVVRGPGGAVQYYEGTLEDITDRRRAEETFRVLFECSSDAHLLFDGAGVFEANAAAAAMLGFRDKAELVGRHPAEFSPAVQPDGRLSAEKCVEMDGRARRFGYHRFDWQHRRADGAEFPCEVTLTPVEVGGRAALLTVWHDLTDRKRSEDAVREGRRRLAVALDNAGHGLWEWDIATGACDLDGNWAAIHGYAPGELADGYAAWEATIHPGDRGRVMAALAAHLADPAVPYDVEYRARRKDGAWAWVNSRGRVHVWDPAGRPARMLGTVHDITTRKRAEEALRAGEERFRAAMEGSLYAVYFLAAERDPGGAVTDFVFTDMNRKGEQLISRSREEVVGRRLCELLPVNRTGGFFDKYVRVVETGEPLEEEFPIREPGVHADWLHHLVVRVGDGVVVTTQNVSARKRAEAELRASEGRFRQVFESSGIGMALAAADGRLLQVNPALGRILGYDPAELVGTTFQALTHPDDLAANLGLKADALAGRRDSYRLEKRYVRKDGRTVRAELTVAVMAAPGEDGAVLVGQVQDVTARKEAEEMVQKARADLLDAIEGLDAGLVMYGPDERLVVCNSRHRELYAAHADALRPGCRYEDVLRSYYRGGGAVEPPGVDEDTWVAGRLAAHRRLGPPREWRHDGRWLLITDRPTRDGGVVSLRTDITALKRAQEAAEAASRAKSEFLANMSHEIRTPMNGILGMTDLVLDTPLAPDQREFLRLVRESGVSLLRIINDVLDFSKVEAGRLGLEAAPFRLRDLVCRTVEPLAVRAAQKGLRLTCRVAPGTPDRVEGDGGRLGQVLVNLVGNAVKFTARGEVALTVGGGDAAEFRFSVSDTGIGVRPEHRESVFEAFVQADASLTRRYGGTGLGLAISARLVALMGGRIWVDSEEGQGSTFHFTARLGVPREQSPTEGGTERDALVWVATAGGGRPTPRPA
ncbi:MAG: PAS domain S-box protein, partial [Gemmataceae bacterium]|nr:PAS domain S-box protein [Gemmataceae bacterium]